MRSKNKKPKNWKKEAWKVFSEYIRRRYANREGMVKCCTCDTIAHWKEMDAGHFIRQAQGNIARWMKENCHAQCKQCNILKDGEQWTHGQYIDTRYGEGTAMRIKEECRETKKMGTADYKKIIEECKEEIKKLS